MTTFVILAALMVIAALAIIAPSLAGRFKIRYSQVDDQNIRIARENLIELRVELEQGRLDEQEYEQARKELESVLIQDISSDGADDMKLHKTEQGRMTLTALFILVPLLVTGSYYLYGTPVALDAQGTPAHTQVQPGQQHSLDQLITRLAERMKSEPNNIDGWLMLGRSYMSVKRFGQATSAYAQAYRLNNKNPEIMLFYADAMAMNQGGRITGRPLELINEALAIQPNNLKALWLLGMSQAESGNYQGAIQSWQTLLPLLKGDDRSTNEVKRLIALAHQKLGTSAPATTTTSAVPAQPAQTATAAKASIKVRVEMDPALAGTYKPTDTLFIYARALQGPPMPLAAVRKQASELPLEVTLDESMAMMPAMSLSQFPQVRVSARISSSGNAARQPGDLIGEVKPVQVNQAEQVVVRINSKIE